ncbi:hypothetical protein KC330_g187 [Hortaea werneckii]|nr:hypothetical protein KC330_g187 [Hortaea werneckii]
MAQADVEHQAIRLRRSNACVSGQQQGRRWHDAPQKRQSVNTHILQFTTQPTLAMRAATRRMPLARKDVPPHLETQILAPASGGPVRQANDTILKPIPILTPALLRSVVKLASVAGNILCIPAEPHP